MIWIRVAIAVLLGYLLMTLSYTLTMVPAITLITPDRLADPETGLMTNWFIFVVQFPVALLTAVVGGVVTAFVATGKGRKQAIKGLVGFVIIVGLVGVAVGLFGSVTDEVEAVSRAGDEPVAEELVVSPVEAPPEQPTWNLLLLPFVGGFGVLLGGRFVDRMSDRLAPASIGTFPPSSPSEDSADA
ncbi:MAG: hypothetical protein CMJ34_05095 [Phycisphaerae bacterium]|nr:hypothetical protein [Phycisphaerae bacterium]|tara:strand:- start:54 stop:611 length:558 start_codon:yes stop_codon:yes gene_type:complete